MPDALTRLRDADPAARAHTPEPPDDVLHAILASAPEQRRRRAPRVALATATLAVAGVAAIAALPSGAGRHAPAPLRASLAERAFAATAPMPGFITYTETTTVQTGGPASLESYDKLRQWQYQDRMHNYMFTRQPRGEWTYEHDQNGGTFRTLMRNDKGATDFQITRKTDPGWDKEELDAGFKVGVTTLVETFREQIETAEDLGETTFNGQVAHAYKGRDPSRGKLPPLGAMTFYVDPDTALPLGMRMVLTLHGASAGEVTTTTTVDRYEHLQPTAENLKLLDSATLDAAQIKRG